MTNNNSATRIHRLLSEASKQPDDKQITAGWVDIFRIEEKSAHKQVILVVNKLNLAFHEVERIRAFLQDSKFEDSVYSTTLTKAESALSPQILHARWNNVKQHLTPDVFVSLSYCGQILPNEELTVTAEDVEHIQEIIKQLRSLLNDSSVPVALKVLAEHHISIIETALSDYSITGAASLKRAAKDAIGDLVANSETIKENESSKVVKKLGSLWSTVNRVADGVLKVERLALLGTSLVKALEHFSK